MSPVTTCWVLNIVPNYRAGVLKQNYQFNKESRVCRKGIADGIIKGTEMRDRN